MTYTAADRNRARRLTYQRAWNEARRTGIPTSLVPATNAARYLAALHTLGWSNTALEHTTHGIVHRTTFSKLTRLNYPNLQRATADGILNIPWTLAPGDNIPDDARVPILGAQRRVQALMAAGWPHDEVRAHAGGFDTSNTIRARTKSISAGAWRDIDRAYNELCMTPGPNPKCVTNARRMGYAPALSWLDIDDPDEKPQGIRTREKRRPHDEIDPAVIARLLALEPVDRPTNAERFEAMRLWLAAGKSERTLCREYGWHEGRYATRRDGAA